MRTGPKQSFRLSDDVMINGHQFFVGFYEANPVILDGIIKETNVFEVCLGDADGGDLIIMQIDDLHLWKICKFEWDFCELV